MVVSNWGELGGNGREHEHPFVCTRLLEMCERVRARRHSYLRASSRSDTASRQIPRAMR
jgi:hypothetical protein